MAETANPGTYLSTVRSPRGRPLAPLKSVQWHRDRFAKILASKKYREAVDRVLEDDTHQHWFRMSQLAFALAYPDDMQVSVSDVKHRLEATCRALGELLPPDLHESVLARLQAIWGSPT